MDADRHALLCYNHNHSHVSQILAKPKISTGKKIDATMDKVRLGLFFRDAEVTKENLEKAKKLIEDVRIRGIWFRGLRGCGVGVWLGSFAFSII